MSGRIDPIGILGLPLQISVMSANDGMYIGPDANRQYWLEASADAEDLEAALVAVRTLLTDTETPIAKIEILVREDNRLVEGVVRDSATG